MRRKKLTLPTQTPINGENLVYLASLRDRWQFENMVAALRRGGVSDREIAQAMANAKTLICSTRVRR